ncbi:MAG: TldD/PmbA family protein, partial [Caldimicrobium sp.]
LHKIVLEEAKSQKAIRRVERESYSFSLRDICLIREGRKLQTTLTEVSFYVSLVAKEEAKEASSYAYSSAKTLEKLNIRDLVRRAAFKAFALSLSEKGPSQRVAILFPPEHAIELLSLLSFSFMGDEVVKGRSHLKDKLGKRIFSPRLNLVDDGVNPELPESRPFDDEGMPQKKTVLISEGEVKSFLWDYYYGKKAGFSSTGNARKKDPASQPKIDHTNLYLIPGELSREELLQREKRVFEVLEILGSHTANPISGDFSFGVSGILYEKGEATTYLAEMALSGNIFEILKDVEVGSDLAFFGSLGSPSLLFPFMDLG